MTIAKGSKEDAYHLVLRCTGLRTQDYTGRRTKSCYDCYGSEMSNTVSVLKGLLTPKDLGGEGWRGDEVQSECPVLVNSWRSWATNDNGSKEVRNGKTDSESCSLGPEYMIPWLLASAHL